MEKNTISTDFIVKLAKLLEPIVVLLTEHLADVTNNLSHSKDVQPKNDGVQTSSAPSEDEIKALAVIKRDENKLGLIKELLKKYGVVRIPDLPAEHYAAFYAELARL